MTAAGDMPALENVFRYVFAIRLRVLFLYVNDYVMRSI